MDVDMLYAIMLEFRVLHDTAIPKTTGHLVHAMFLNLVKQFDPTLSARLHHEPGYRPYTLSPLRDVQATEECIQLRQGQVCRLRVTLLDGGLLWRRLSTHFLEAGPITVQLRSAALQLIRMHSSPEKVSTGLVSTTHWHTLASLSAHSVITFHFVSPTAFSLGKRSFALIPKPVLLWEALLRVWNTYAPAEYHCAWQELREALCQIRVILCDLHIDTFQYPEYMQKGFVGRCSYQIPVHAAAAPFLTTLAAFAPYAGVGYKTTMGMGQTKTILECT
jgi:CRISPR-associated endoribonuclease Cas6